MRIRTSFLVAGLWCLTLAPRALAADVFDTDATHPWNRLHRAFYTRPMQDGKLYDQESLDPPFIPRSKFLLEGSSHKQAIAALDQFLKNHDDRLITDPLKRAVLQRDLWAVFAMITQPDRGYWEQRRALQMRLAQVMRRVALSADEIAALPDNLTEAIRSGTFAKAYDEKQADRAFLPPDLLAPDGSWVALGNRLRHDHLPAPSHAEFVKGRSSFTILLRLPEGRDATKAYVSDLEKSKQKTDGGFVIVTETPQIPPGTQVALVRRTLLIDKSGALRATPLVESIQIRVYRQIDTIDVYEITLDRAALFARRDGGLRPLDITETAYYASPFGIVNMPNNAGDFSSADPLERNELPRAPVVLRSCSVCHPGTGIYGFQSLFVDHFDSYPLRAADAARQIDATLTATQKLYDWGLLQGLWETQPKSDKGTEK